MADKHGSTVSLLNSQACCYILQGKYDEAETLLQEAFDKVCVRNKDIDHNIRVMERIERSTL